MLALDIVVLVELPVFEGMSVLESLFPDDPVLTKTWLLDDDPVLTGTTVLFGRFDVIELDPAVLAELGSIAVLAVIVLFWMPDVIALESCLDAVVSVVVLLNGSVVSLKVVVVVAFIRLEPLIESLTDGTGPSTMLWIKLEDGSWALLVIKKRK